MTKNPKANPQKNFKKVTKINYEWSNNHVSTP